MDAFAHRVLAWYDEFGRRDLPWQRAASPYAVWISEIMLQQTQVATVIPYYERFMARFPTVYRLAAAPRDDVLAHWAGLGYYARARNLYSAAATIVADHGGELPDNMMSLQALPGIGRSTAGAILALAYCQRQAILDGNVKRVLTRFYGVSGWPGRANVLQRLWALAEKHTPRRRVAEYTQAIMDLGATLCTRSSPGCNACPLNRGCVARAAGTQGQLPTPKPRALRPQRQVSVLLVQDKQRRVLLERRPDSGIWGGLFSLPELGTDEDADYWCARHLGAGVSSRRSLAPIDHAFTHFDLRIAPMVLELRGAPRNVMEDGEWLWYKPADEMDFGVAAPIGALLNLL
jgi:A/G-specific adenine glycosylase